MKELPRLVAAAIFLSMGACVSAAQTDPSSSAKTVFDEYQRFERTFDPALADLYCDTALIRNTREYPNGQTRTLEFPGEKYKQLIRASLPMAKEKGDYSTYSDIAFVPEGENVRISATRYSVLKKYSSPISLLIGSCNGGNVRVLEEIGESQP